MYRFLILALCLVLAYDWTPYARLVYLVGDDTFHAHICSVPPDIGVVRLAYARWSVWSGRRGPLTKHNTLAYVRGSWFVELTNCEKNELPTLG